VVTQIAIVTTEFFWCEEPTQASFSIAGTYVATTPVQNFDNCFCGTCPAALTLTSEFYPDGFPGYQYGNFNPIQVNTISGVIGVRSLDVVLTYAPSK